MDGEISDAQALGLASYTLSYRPHPDPADGSFRHIEVSMRDPSLHVLTKAGYFAPTGKSAVGTQRAELVSLADAAQSTIPYSTLKMTIHKLVRPPDSGTVQFTIALQSSRLIWNRGKDGTSTTDAAVAAVSLSRQPPKVGCSAASTWTKRGLPPRRLRLRTTQPWRGGRESRRPCVKDCVKRSSLLPAGCMQGREERPCRMNGPPAKALKSSATGSLRLPRPRHARKYALSRPRP